MLLSAISAEHIHHTRTTHDGSKNWSIWPSDLYLDPRLPSANGIAGPFVHFVSSSNSRPSLLLLLLLLLMRLSSLHYPPLPRLFHPRLFHLPLPRQHLVFIFALQLLRRLPGLGALHREQMVVGQIRRFRQHLLVCNVFVFFFFFFFNIFIYIFFYIFF